MTTETHQPGVSPARVERRRNLRLRSRFDEARRLLEPLLGTDPMDQGGTRLYRAMNRLQQAFPELKPVELEALVASVVRAIVNRER
ncbi:MAG: hypothetical protein NZ524_03985 [Thiobacillaceae bacterium]|nr:hypothetical protein [Thiobacillaceae bacterium]MDW8323522.1 hypothetical protein [Burkholderiales bacterium]